MLLPIFASLVAPFLAIIARVLQIIPALVAIVFEFVAALLALFAPLVPGFTAVVDPIAPLVVTILRAITPVRTLLGARAPSFADTRADQLGADSVDWPMRARRERHPHQRRLRRPGKLPEPFAGSWEGLLPGRVPASPRDGFVPRKAFARGGFLFQPRTTGSIARRQLSRSAAR